MKKYFDMIPKTPVCRIRWLDHYGQDGWKDLKNDGPDYMVMESVGFLLSEDKHYYRLAQTLNNQNEKDSALHILKKSTIEIKYMRGKPKNKEK